MEARIQAFSDAAISVLKDDFEAMVQESFQKGRTLMSGSLTTESINLLHHPYKVRANFPINRQTGRLFNSFQVSETKDRYVIFFDESKARYARYVIKGTKNLKPRDVLEVLIKDFPAQAAKLKE